VTANDGTDDDCAAFAIAVSEACANVVEHAYGPVDASISLEARLTDEVATVVVRDRGQWRGPSRGNRGRGIPVMKEFMDDVSIETGERGTTVELRRRLGART
jgi:anti-sigma regulatory factor (Ser/Thr protein kinase)